jgi:hypothetical protein
VLIALEAVSILRAGNADEGLNIYSTRFSFLFKLFMVYAAVAFCSIHRGSLMVAYEDVWEGA